MLEFKGTVEDIIYRNQENLYSVFVMDVEEDLLTVVGKVFELNIGDILTVTGEMVEHRDYGKQLKLNSYQKHIPKSITQIEKYLASGIISNIGSKRAHEIVSIFGEDTLDILTNNPEKLQSIPGIGKKTAQKIHDSILSVIDSSEIFIYLQKFNLGTKLSTDIYTKYKEKTKEIIENNPYQLIDDIKGIGFLTADNIGLSNGIQPDSEFRLRAGAMYVLENAANKDGDCYLIFEDFISRASKILNVKSDIIEEQIPFLVFNDKIKIEEVENKQYVYLSYIYDIENSIAGRLMNILNSNNKYSKIDLDKEIEYIERLENIEYSLSQKEAIKTALNEKLMIITGGPGTGKTTIIKAIISIAHNLKINYVLCAPTGRAAKRMEESTGKEASTIHRLLGYKSFSDEFSLDFNEHNPLDADFIIVDEASMVDIFLMNNLLKAIKQDCMLILVGDSDQLPSVGAGNVLNDLINSNIIPTIKLDTIFRQSEGSNIIKNAHLINKGQKPILNEEGKDFFFIQTRNDGETLETIVDLVSNRLPNHYGVDKLEDIQVLTPTRRGICGVDSINKKLQYALNPPEFNKSEIKMGEIIFREQDKVMQTKNNYELELKDDKFNSIKGIFNGDIGYIRNIFANNKSMEIKFYQRLAKYKYKDSTDLSLAYCATIHKSQGSEFPIVVIPMANAPYMLLTRNILYTGITRGKSIVVLVGSLDILNKMISNTNSTKRNSTLDYQLKKMSELRGIYD